MLVLRTGIHNIAKMIPNHVDSGFARMKKTVPVAIAVAGSHPETFSWTREKGPRQLDVK